MLDKLLAFARRLLHLTSNAVPTVVPPADDRSLPYDVLVKTPRDGKNGRGQDGLVRRVSRIFRPRGAATEPKIAPLPLGPPTKLPMNHRTLQVPTHSTHATQKVSILAFTGPKEGREPSAPFALEDDRCEHTRDVNSTGACWQCLRTPTHLPVRK